MIVRRAISITGSAVLAFCLFAASASSASSQSGGLIVGNGPGVSSTTIVDAKISGTIVVQFHGDPAAGCASRGLCAYSGVIVWRAVAAQFGSALVIQKSRRHGRVSYAADLIEYGLPGAGADTSAVVRRALPGGTSATCADASSQTRQVALDVNRAQVSMRLLGSGSPILSTRCAGPLDADVSRALPVSSLPVGAAIAGHRRIDLSGGGSFAAAGFAGTVRSTVAVSLGTAHTVGRGSGSPPPGQVPQIRVVTVPLTLTSVAGTIRASVLGALNPDACLLLDSCGLAGTTSLRPRPPASQGELVAYGPARRPYLDYLAALGLSRRGNPRGIAVQGSVAWNRGGSIATDIRQSGECRDSGPLSTGVVALQPEGKVLDAYYGLGYSGFGRLRCPGPELGLGSGPNSSLISGSVGIGTLADRRFSISLGAGSSLSDDGYTARVSGSLLLSFVRGAPRQTFFGAG